MYSIIRAIRTCTACPSQWDLWSDDGTYFYVRYRWGHLTVDRGSVMGEQILSKYVGDDFDGSMSFEELIEHTKDIFMFGLTAETEEAF